MRSPVAIICLSVGLAFVLILGLPIIMWLISVYWIHSIVRTVESGQLPRTETGNVSFDSAYNRGMAEDMAGKWDLAINDFTQAIQRDPENAHGYYMRGFVEMEKGDLEPAIQDLSHYLQAKPQDPDAYVCRGQVNQMAGHLEEAISDYRKETEIRPSDSSHSRLRIWLAETENAANRNLANDELKRFIHDLPTPVDEHDVSLTIARFLAGEFSREELLQKIPNPEYPDDLPTTQREAAFYIGMFDLREGNISAVRESFQASISGQGTSPGWRTSVEYRIATKWLADHPN